MSSSYPIVPPDVFVTVRFATPSGSSYSQSSATLKGAITESMMQNQLAVRYPGKKILILSARPSNSRGVTAKVTYQTTGKGGGGTRSTVPLQDALTESMAHNQIQVRYPDRTVSILSVSFQKN